MTDAFGTASFYTMGAKDTFHNAMNLSKSAFDTAFKDRLQNNNILTV